MRHCLEDCIRECVCDHLGIGLAILVKAEALLGLDLLVLGIVLQFLQQFGLAVVELLNLLVAECNCLDVLGADFRPITDSQKKQLEINYGLEVVKVSGGKMKEAGVPKGFIIQRVNDQPMRTFDDLQNAVKEANNSKDQMLVIRGIFPTGKKGGFVVYLMNE